MRNNTTVELGHQFTQKFKELGCFAKDFHTHIEGATLLEYGEPNFYIEAPLILKAHIYSYGKKPTRWYVDIL